jgi:hypothetical protein
MGGVSSTNGGKEEHKYVIGGKETSRKTMT